MTTATNDAGQTVGRQRTVGSLFSRYGGLDLAVEEAFHARTLWFSEINEPLSKVFTHHWPKAAALGDITKINWEEVPRVDILCGGFPCQDISNVGKHAGMKPGTRSGLWTHMAQAIRILKPTTVVIENVRGILSTPANQITKSASGRTPNAFTPRVSAVRGMDQRGESVGDGRGGSVRALGVVLGDLADLGMDARWIGLPASRIGTPHPRYRIFILAYPTASDPTCFRHQTQQRTPSKRESPAGNHRPVPPAHRPGHQPTTRTITDWADYSTAIRMWERISEMPVPPALIVPETGPMQPNPVFVEWMMGLEPGWVTDPVLDLPLVEQLAALGNGVVPGQALLAIRTLLSTIPAAPRETAG